MPCPVCNAEHTGPCPKMPKPPETQAQQQLTGWLPGKQTQTEAEMKAELAKPATLGPTLQSFLQRVFNDSGIMAGGDGVANKIYNLYNSSGDGGVTPEAKVAKQFYLAIWSMRDRHPQLSKGRLQYTKVSLEKMAEACKDANTSPRKKYLTDFVYFPVADGSPQCRLYLNVKFSSIPDILCKICIYITANKDQVVSFKCAGALDANRADSIVVYCTTKAAAEKMGKHMLTIAGAYNTEVPGMTTRLDPTQGVAIGAEPEWQATGMGEVMEGYPESAQSFGSIRSQLIAMAILNYNANVAVYGKGFETFARFVCTAFRGYGLDPMAPGD